MIEKLKERNVYLININKDNAETLKRQMLIQKMLSDKNCFFKINIETAYAILKDLQIPEEDFKRIYSELIDMKNYIDE